MCFNLNSNHIGIMQHLLLALAPHPFPSTPTALAATAYCAVLQTHHTGWQYKLWDAEACEQLLVQQYPWFLDTWRMLGRHEHSTVLKSGE